MICEVEGCWSKIFSKGLCSAHYNRLRDHGDINYVPWSGDHGSRKESIVEIKEDFAELKIPTGEIVKIDIEDAESVRMFSWSLNKATGYIDSTRANTTLHQFVKGKAPENKVIDHDNRDKLDCRKANLIYKSRVENALNRIFKENVGVVLRVYNPSLRWQAMINVDKKQISLGSFGSEEEAIKARKAAEVKYFGAEFLRESNIKKDEPAIEIEL